jgi:YgiT-type zinc finger domain-containing protein
MKGVNKMSRGYQKCFFCGGKVVEEKITVDYRWGEEFLAVFKNVPAGVCQVCGEQYFKSEIVKEMERVVQSKEEAKEIIQIPVRELQMF